MLTIDQKVEMYRMRLEGKSYQVIADRFGVSRQYVYQLIGQQCKSEPYRNVNVPYTGLKKWMNESRYSIAELSRESGCTDNHSKGTIASYLQGSPRMAMAEAVKPTTVTNAFAPVRSKAQIVSMKIPPFNCPAG